MDKTKSNGMLMKDEYFGELLPFVKNSDITDIDFDGSNVWITDINNVCSNAGIHLSRIFIEQFSNRIANVVSRPFNQGNVVLEAETELLRVSIGHEEVVKSGRAISIRKSSPTVRFTAKEAIQSNYCSLALYEFLVNATLAGLRIVVCGETGAGKTELCKVLSSYIPKEERVITIEDNLEWHYGKINPGANHLELKINEEFDYSQAIKFALRQHPKRIMLSEARGEEAKELIVAWSTGHSGFSTLHTDSVLNIPDRLIQMMPSQRDAERLINDVYRYVDIGILVRIKEKDGRKYRLIDEACVFNRKNKENEKTMLVRDGELVCKVLPEKIIRKFDRMKISDPWGCDRIKKELGGMAAEDKKA
jgi:pilus assembly protein CpaF